MSKGSRVVSATRNDLTVTVAVLKVACEPVVVRRGHHVIGSRSIKSSSLS